MIRFAWFWPAVALLGATRLFGIVDGIPTRPHLYLTGEPVDGLTGVKAFRQGIAEPPLQSLWQRQLQRAEAALEKPAYDVTTEADWRAPRHVESRAVDRRLVRRTGRRLVRGALAHLVTGEERFKDDVVAQIEALLDRERWPNWTGRVGEGEPGTHATARTGDLLRALSVTYDWIYPALSETFRWQVVDGMVRRGLDPFWRTVEDEALHDAMLRDRKTRLYGGVALAAMSLGRAYPRSDALSERARSFFDASVRDFGPEGEFHDAVGRVASLNVPVAYYLALYYHTRGEIDRLGRPPFPDAATWLAHMTLPPGRLAAMGDTRVRQPVTSNLWAAVANATRNGVFQKLALEYATQDLDPKALAYLSADVEPEPPAERLALFRAYRAWSGVAVSRASWDLRSTPSVVYSKVGRPVRHAHNDIGAVMVDGHRKRLLVDLGRPRPYPKNYHDPEKRYAYYPAASRGHNVVTLGEGEMRRSGGRYLRTGFAPEFGAWWQMEVSDAYPNAHRVTRTVAHLHPRYVVVVDQVLRKEEGPIALRWHTADAPETSGGDGFRVANGDVALEGLLAVTDGPAASRSVGRHRYPEGLREARDGSAMKQREEPYVAYELNAASCRIVSFFVVRGPDDPPGRWEASEGGWSVPNGPSVSVDPNTLDWTTADGESWLVPLP